MDAHAPKKNNALNTVGIITVGVVGSVFVYVAIVGLQALYVSETSPLATVKSFGAQGEVKDSLKAEQIGNITEPRSKSAYNNTPLYSIGIDAAKQLIVRDASDPSRFVPAIGPSVKATIAPAFGRPQPLPATPPPPPAPPAGDASGAAGGTVPAGSGLPDGPAGGDAAGSGGPSGPPATGTPGSGSGNPAGNVGPATTSPTPPAAGGATSTPPAGGSTPPAGGAAPAAGGTR